MAGKIERERVRPADASFVFHVHGRALPLPFHINFQTLIKILDRIKMRKFLNHVFIYIADDFTSCDMGIQDVLHSLFTVKEIVQVLV